MARIKLFSNLDVKDGTVGKVSLSGSCAPWGTGVARFLTIAAVPKDTEEDFSFPASARGQSNASTRCPSPPSTRCPSPMRPSSASVSSRAPTRPSSAAASFSTPRTRPSSAAASFSTPRTLRDLGTDSVDPDSGEPHQPVGRPQSAIPRRSSASRQYSESAQGSNQRPSSASTSRPSGKATRASGGLATVRQQATTRDITRVGTGKSDADFELPEWYLLDGESQPEGGPLLPRQQTWLSLRGGNGTWRRQRAREDWLRRKREHAELEQAREVEQRHLQIRRAEQEEKGRAAMEELKQRVQEAERERLRKLAEKDALKLEKVEAERRRALEEDRRWFLRQPRLCDACAGSGKCKSCIGKGHVATFYLVPSIKSRATTTHGSLPRGCATCGGSGDDASWGAFECGSGKCNSCAGSGKVFPPKGEWSDEGTSDVRTVYSQIEERR